MNTNRQVTIQVKMNASFLKCTLTAVLLATLSTIQMMAEEQLENRVSKLESQMRQVRTETALGSYSLNRIWKTSE